MQFALLVAVDIAPYRATMLSVAGEIVGIELSVAVRPFGTIVYVTAWRRIVEFRRRQREFLIGSCRRFGLNRVGRLRVRYFWLVGRWVTGQILIGADRLDAFSFRPRLISSMSVAVIGCGSLISIKRSAIRPFAATGKSGAHAGGVVMMEMNSLRLPKSSDTSQTNSSCRWATTR